MSRNRLTERRAGILLHPTSLPSGKLEADADQWLDLLRDCGLRVWQFLPLGEPQAGLSPYQCISAFALNPALFDYDSSQHVDSADYVRFCSEQAFWLDDYALFKVLKEQFDDAQWIDWPTPYRDRHEQTLIDAVAEHAVAINVIKHQQYSYHQRWQQIRARATDYDILLFGDMPIFVGHDSADVWAHPEWFLLDDDGLMEVVTGVPPDYFSETGQRWGNPHYDWDVMAADDYRWWCSRVEHHLELFDLVRIDHFRGLEAVWVIDAACDTAIDGEWQEVPGEQLLDVLQTSLEACHDQLPLVAEDLGIITPEVTALRNKYSLPGMSVLQFGFDEFDDNPHKLKNIEADRVVYTGTHDNDTTKGWFNSLQEYDKKLILESLELPESAIDDTDSVVDRMIENAIRSRGIISIIPMQDYLSLDSRARMNIPGTIEDNWTWQFQWQQLDPARRQLILDLVRDSSRLAQSG